LDSPQVLTSVTQGGVWSLLTLVVRVAMSHALLRAEQLWRVGVSITTVKDTIAHSTRSSSTSNSSGSELWLASCRLVANVGICGCSTLWQHGRNSV
jgi:hypothetical protein